MRIVTQIDIINKEGSHEINYSKICNNYIIDAIDGVIYQRKDQVAARKLIADLYLEVTTGKAMFFVYKYTFSNGEYYFGRSRVGTRRFGEYTRYKENQELQALMKEEAGKFKKERLFTTPNLMRAAFEEWNLITQYGDEVKCLNKRIKYDWMTEGAASIRNYLNDGIELHPCNIKNLERSERIKAIEFDRDVYGANSQAELVEIENEILDLKERMLDFKKEK